MSALDFGGGGGSNTTRWYSFALPQFPNGDWCIGVWVRLTTTPPAATYPTICRNTARTIDIYHAPDPLSGWAAQQAGGTLKEGYPFTNIVYDGRDLLHVLQRRSTNYEFYSVPEGTSASALSTVAHDGTQVAADTYGIGSDSTNAQFEWINPAGEFFFLNDRSLTASEITTLAAGAQITSLYTPLVYLPFRDGDVATETNQGSGGSSYDATKAGTGYATGANFFEIGPAPRIITPTTSVSMGR
jgi:hypothetical protein